MLASCSVSSKWTPGFSLCERPWDHVTPFTFFRLSALRGLGRGAGTESLSCQHPEIRCSTAISSSQPQPLSPGSACPSPARTQQRRSDEWQVVLHFLDADRLPSEDLAEINLFATEADAAAMRNYNRSVVESVVDVRQSLVDARGPRPG